MSLSESMMNKRQEILKAEQQKNESNLKIIAQLNELNENLLKNESEMTKKFTQSMESIKKYNAVTRSQAQQALFIVKILCGVSVISILVVGMILWRLNSVLGGVNNGIYLLLHHNGLV